ncbi:MAG: hypothetical protein OQJ89_05905, partial [Kangiellaceae bacterium]|nr:hypothetical protein [Kangiellaceae bacterium]
ASLSREVSKKRIELGISDEGVFEKVMPKLDLRFKSLSEMSKILTKGHISLVLHQMEFNYAPYKQARIERDKETLLDPHNIGIKICKNTTIEYEYFAGTVIEQPIYKTIRQSGQIQAFLEGQSNDGKRIRFRVRGIGTDANKFHFRPSSTPKADGFTLEIGLIYWDAIEGWFPCGKP